MKNLKNGDNVYCATCGCVGKVIKIAKDNVYIELPDQSVHMTKAEFCFDTIDDNINHPSRYTKGKIECIEAIESAVSDLNGIEAFCTGNVIKYVWRWKQKEQEESLKKARWYLDYLIEKVEKNVAEEPAR